VVFVVLATVNIIVIIIILNLCNPFYLFFVFIFSFPSPFLPSILTEIYYRTQLVSESFIPVFLIFKMAIFMCALQRNLVVTLFLR
jgi:hypothetical protein